MDAPETHTPHGSHSGHRWFDMAIGIGAMLVSCISLYVAVHHGRTMEKLVAASSWPSLTPVLAIKDVDDAVVVSLSVRNAGVGPAKLQSIELWHRERPIADVREVTRLFLRAAGVGEETLRVAATGSDRVIAANETSELFSLTMNARQFRAAAYEVTPDLGVKLCYCSVFDDCHVLDARRDAASAEPVKRCERPPQRLDLDLSNLLGRKAAATPASGVR